MALKDSEIVYSPKSCFDVFRGESFQRKIDDLAVEYLEFLSHCKTERETVRWIELECNKKMIGEDVGSSCFYRTLKEKTIVLVRRGKRSLKEGVRILGAHLDSPRIDLKQHPLYEECELALAKTHYYGGIRKYQWFSRPLALHGVIVKTDGTKIEINIGEEPNEPVLVISDLLPHLAYRQNQKKLSEAFEAEKMNVIVGSVPYQGEEEKEEKEKVKRAVLQLLHSQYNIVEEDLYSAELQLVPAGRARFVGLDSSLIGGYGQDDRICVFCSFKAFFATDEPEFTQIVIFWDKEEIGSEGATSARSRFLEYLMEEIIEKWGEMSRPSEVFLASKAISADVHCALDPAYQDLHDRLNASLLGYGPVFCKFTGHRGKIGANDASAEYVAYLRNILNKKDIPWQMAELGKVDEGGGGTVAKFLARYGMDIVDLGPPILGMHSPFEVSSKMDLYATFLGYAEFLR